MGRCLEGPEGKMVACCCVPRALRTCALPLVSCRAFSHNISSSCLRFLLMNACCYSITGRREFLSATVGAPSISLGGEGSIEVQVCVARSCDRCGLKFCVDGSLAFLPWAE